LCKGILLAVLQTFCYGDIVVRYQLVCSDHTIRFS